MPPKSRVSAIPTPKDPAITSPSTFKSTSSTSSAGGPITFGHSSSTPYTPKPSTNTPSKSSSTAAGKSASATSTKQQLDPHNAGDVLNSIWRKYMEQTPQRVKLMDAFMGFLIVVGVLQFLYCLIVGNFPFNAFLSGFSATVGQFVLTASLRIQTNPENKSEFGSISNERAFADFVFGSLLLHFFCVNFIN
ncbi:defender against death DAD protein [Delitschia confertaspora ATCC 74209]|uniref:Dolichyl-diphosphooligosaccharide--protein glycosyltransferase subunit OST2 n=1 Tax=Delitschia confertaspora ATCC 74209 TaxID=1513339 RepID=A0A9P4JSS1_9PLEO|nr:defender against death DAD protein [Delitschia confertaspora ATCC 74209]